MKECDIVRVVKTYSDPTYIFSGVMTPKPQDLRPPPGVDIRQTCFLQ